MAAFSFGRSAMRRAISVNVSRALGAQLIDLRAGGDDLALQRPLGLARHPHVDQVDRDADARARRAAALDRKIRLRSEARGSHRSVKSSSAAPPSGTVTGLGSEALPSFQAITL